MNRFARIALKTILWIIGGIITLFILIVFLLRLPSIQNYIAGKVTHYVEGKIGTPVKIGYINIDFPKKLILEDIYLEDQSKDTLVAGKSIAVDINMLKLLKNTVEIQSLEADGITAKIRRSLPDSSFNFDYIVKAFASEKESEPTADTASALLFNLDKVKFSKIHVVYADAVIGTSADVYLGRLNTNIKKFDLTKNMAFELPKINIDGLNATVKQWKPAVEGAGPSVEDFGITDKTAQTTSLLPDVGIQVAELSNVLVRYEDESSALKSQFILKNFYAAINKIDLKNEFVDIQKLQLDGSDHNVLLGKIQKSSAAAAKTSKTEADSSSAAKMNWVVSAKDININNTSIRFKDDNQPRIKGFDYFNIHMPGLKTQLTDLYYSADSISGSLKELVAADHSGFAIKQLKADFNYTSTSAEIKNLYAETPRTLIRDYIKLSYPSLDIITKKPELIRVNASLIKSYIDMRDIRFFAPFLDTMEVMKPLMDKKFYIDTRVAGRVDDLNIPNIDFRTLSNTRLIASLHLKGLPDMNKLSVDLNLKKLTTGRSDIEKLVSRSMLPQNIELPNAIGLSGTFKGGMASFNTKLALVTEKGTAKLDGKVAMAKRDTSYEASVSVRDLDIGKIMKMDSTLGILSFEGKIKGKGTDPKKMMASFDGKVNRMDAMGYRYHDIDMDLSADKGAIKASVISPDPNIKLKLDATAQMDATYPKIAFEMNVDSINLQKLNLVKDAISYRGKLSGNFSTADPNLLNGEAQITNSLIRYNNDRYALDTVSLLAKADSSRNQLQLRSDFLNAHLVGKYKILELQSAVQDLLQLYYTPEKPIKIPPYSPQLIEFSAQLTRNRLIQDFLPELTEMKAITLDGRFDSGSKNLSAKLDAPRVVYGGTEINNVTLDINSLDSSLYYSALINKVKVSSIEITNTILSGKVAQNIVNLGLWIKDKQDKEQYHLGADMQVKDGLFVFSLLQDGLMLNYDKWDVAPNNTLKFGSAGILADNFVLSNKGQELRIASQDSILNSPVDVAFKNFRIETLSKMVMSDSLNLGGGINGQTTLSRLESSPVFVADLIVDKFYFGKDTVGNVNIKVNNERENTYSANVSVTENGNNLVLSGDFINPPQGDAALDFTLDIAPLTMKTVQAFSMGNLKDSKGNLEGQLKIVGSPSKPQIRGDLYFREAEFNVAMLNALFKAKDEQIRFDQNGLSFPKFELEDSKGNIAQVSGSVNTQTYTDFDFDIGIAMENFEVLNSTQADNDLFYGKMFLGTDLQISGNLNKPVVDGTIKVLDSTDFTMVMPNNDPGMADRKGVVEFVDKRDTATTNALARLDSMTVTKLTGIDVDLNLQTDKDAKFKILLDAGSQDALNIQGEAELNTGMDASGKITMSGTFTVEQGSYSFSFGPVKKDFTFQKGSTITWNGDPLDAQLNITAAYTLKAPTLELVAPQLGTQNANLYKQKIPFDVLLKITDKLFQPQLNFDIDLNANNAIVSQDVISKVDNALSTLRENPSDLNKQVFSLIVLGRFMSANPFESLSGGGGTEALVRNSVSSFLSSQLNRLASDLITGVELDFNLTSEDDYSTGTAQTRTDLNIGVSKMLLNDRLKVNIGSNFEVEGNSRPGEAANNIAGDIQLDYQLSQDGRYFARFYRKNQYQVTLQGQFVETGIGFIITMDYNRFKEIFMRSKKLKEYYNTGSKKFRKRFDVDRMEQDSAYRDSVRTVIRDSLMLHSPEYRKQLEDQQKEQQRRQQVDSAANNGRKKSMPTHSDTIRTTAIKNEDEERSYHAN
ncbi:translocation/assembly module TamB domain-containing protein [Sphingobacterium sp. UGAL515B_05]|uniref:translocation/assembly module TamB domain-containing protein n=1 Tax=Sphingobacterium sp. UGAL515B_05 TaxID=2986767 RepID=UPI002954C129|nr:translocation/assembly module TamB domain-containing protein [Sphingobacterium sp. UGAL515B_05]WON92548.1 translocation/assembly module TamB domain-containing protein [Sphingobacterium sp. UGAL515B_05]